VTSMEGNVYPFPLWLRPLGSNPHICSVFQKKAVILVRKQQFVCTIVRFRAMGWAAQRSIVVRPAPFGFGHWHAPSFLYQSTGSNGWRGLWGWRQCYSAAATGSSSGCR